MDGDGDEEIANLEARVRELEERDLERQTQARKDASERASLLSQLAALHRERVTTRTRSIGRSDVDPVNAEPASLVGLDIGGTLAKLVFFEPDSSQSGTVAHLAKFINASEAYGTTGQRLSQLKLAFGGGVFHFIVFETARMTHAVDLIVAHNLHHAMSKISASGGGAFKYAEMFEERAQIKFEVQGELECMVRGLLFLVRHDSELYTLHAPNLSIPTPSQNIVHEVRPLRCEDMFPFIVVNIGSGVSILQVESEASFERVSGSALGGATYLGLSQLLGQCDTFEEALKMAEEGHASNVDLLVGDIYGGACDTLNLPANATAACFGKMRKRAFDSVRPHDYTRALLTMLSNNLGQIAFLVARQHKARHVIFAGSFLRHNAIAQRSLAYAMEFWSRGQIEALFLKHEGFCGAMGALLCTTAFDSVPAHIRQRRAHSVA